MIEYPKFKFVTKSLVEEVSKLKFTDKDFEKFTDPNHPFYKEYKDRTHELWHDRGYNNAINAVLHILNRS